MPTYKIANATPAFGGKPSKFGSQKYSVNLSLEGVTEQPLFEVASLDDIDNGADLAGKTVAGEIQSKKSENGHAWTKFVGALVDGPAAPAANSPAQPSSNGEPSFEEKRAKAIHDSVVFKGAVDMWVAQPNDSLGKIAVRARALMQLCECVEIPKDNEPVLSEEPPF